MDMAEIDSGRPLRQAKKTATKHSQYRNILWSVASPRRKVTKCWEEQTSNIIALSLCHYYWFRLFLDSIFSQTCCLVGLFLSELALRYVTWRSEGMEGHIISGQDRSAGWFSGGCSVVPGTSFSNLVSVFEPIFKSIKSPFIMLESSRLTSNFKALLAGVTQLQPSCNHDLAGYPIGKARQSLVLWCSGGASAAIFGAPLRGLIIHFVWSGCFLCIQNVKHALQGQCVLASLVIRLLPDGRKLETSGQLLRPWLPLCW